MPIPTTAPVLVNPGPYDQVQIPAFSVNAADVNGEPLIFASFRKFMVLPSGAREYCPTEGEAGLTLTYSALLALNPERAAQRAALFDQVMLELVLIAREKGLSV